MASSISSSFPLARAIRVVSVINVLWAVLAGLTGNWEMVALQVSAAVVLFGVSFLIPKPALRPAVQKTHVGQEDKVGESVLQGREEAGQTPTKAAALFDVESDSEYGPESLVGWIESYGSGVNPEDFKRAVEGGADTTEEGVYGDDLITLATLYGAHPEVVECLLEAGVRPNNWVDLFENALPDVDPRIIELFLREGMDPNNPTTSHASFLEEALESQAPEGLIMALIDGGAHTSEPTIHSRTLLGLALESGPYALPVLKALIPRPPEGEVVDSDAHQEDLNQALSEVVGELEMSSAREPELANLAGWLVAQGANPMASLKGIGEDPVMTRVVDEGASTVVRHIARSLDSTERIRMLGWVMALNEKSARELSDFLDGLEETV